MTAKDVSFPPSANPSAQVEALIVNTIVVLIGLGWSNLGLACAAFAARRYGINSDISRVIQACFLITLGFFAGLARSRMPRLTLASRAISFIGIWLVARAPGTLEWDYHNFTELLFAFSIAGAASLFVSLVAGLFTRPGGYANDLVDVLEIIKDLLHHSTSQMLTNGEKSTLQTGTLHSKNLEKALALHTSYAYSVYELRVGKVPIKAIKPLLITVNRIREELAWGKAPALEGTETPSRESSTLAQLDDPCSACAIAIADGISTLQAAVGKCFGIQLPNDTHKTIDLDDPLMAQTNIANARAGLKAALSSIVHETNKTCTLGRVESHHKELFRKSLYSVSLLQISSELIHALALAHGLLTIHHAAPRPYIFFPRPSWFWLGMSPRSVVAEEDISSTPRSVTETGTEFGEDRLLFDEARMAPLPVPTTTAHGRKWSLVNFMCTPAILHARIRLSNWLWRARHSKDLQFAFKHALGIAILMIPAVLPESSSAKQYYDSSYGVWAIISFVYVIEPNTALTWRTAIWRVLGTGLGALYAFTAWYIVGTNPYGVVVLAAEIFITWLVRSSTPGVGIVASITIPPVLFIPYLGIGDTSMPRLTALRALQISIGIIAAVLIDHMIFPKRVCFIFLGGMAKVIEDTRELYSGLSSRTHSVTAEPKSELARARSYSAKRELRIRKLVTRENIHLSQMEHEISLIPVHVSAPYSFPLEPTSHDREQKPIASYRKAIDYVQRLVDLIAGLRRIRQNVPHGAIAPVLAHQKRVDSCITLALYACEHAFRSQRALPHILPSCRKVFDAELRIDTLQTDVGHAMAENEVMEQVACTVDGLVQVARELFGTRIWLEGVDDVHLGIGL
ncbi:Protocadherin alpha-C1 [Rhizoctonia solani]|uniref:Protocadherin alpha-C1 n=1 Tax=Rhizoctonia solani TaxID=456999 RepID=A0A0K6G4U3_9AGAM|nr:Protocadherin alpha-C1 [Rhizoctonia solani]